MGYKFGTWNVKLAVIWVFTLSFINEVLEDPKANGVPFFDAWENLAFDLLGLAIFVVLYRIWRKKFK